MTDSRPTGVHFRARGRMAVHTIWDHITRPIARTIDDCPLVCRSDITRLDDGSYVPHR
jgi:hypothetical protein